MNERELDRLESYLNDQCLCNAENALSSLRAAHYGHAREYLGKIWD